MLEALVAAATGAPAGAFVEVGVYKGGSARRLYNLAQKQKRQIYLFDTFTGMPFADDGDSHPVGHFKDTDLSTLFLIMPNACFCQGIFPDTLPTHLANIAFAHIDCDQYRSITACIDHLGPLMVPGGIMWFDDTVLSAGMRAVLGRFAPSRLEAAPEGRMFVRF